jgi:DNA-binding NarL/FixJ family response regulator
VTTLHIDAATATARAGLAEFLDARTELRVVVGVPGSALAQQIDDVGPDIVLVDLGAGRAARKLRDMALSHVPPVLVLLADHWGSLDAASLRAGLRAVLPRRASAEEIAAAIEAVAHGLVVLHPDAVSGLRRAPVRAPGGAAVHEPLTGREIQVLGAMADGLGNKAIAARLGISAHTVKFHIASIFSKLSAASRAEAVAIGLRQGLIMI